MKVNNILPLNYLKENILFLGTWFSKSVTIPNDCIIQLKCLENK